MQVAGRASQEEREKVVAVPATAVRFATTAIGGCGPPVSGMTLLPATGIAMVWGRDDSFSQSARDRFFVGLVSQMRAGGIE